MPAEPERFALPPAAIDRAEANVQFLERWLHGRGAHTRRAYRADIGRFLASAGKPLGRVILGDLHAFAARLASLAPTSRARTLSAVKSLLAFGHRLAYRPVDVGGALRLPPSKATLADRILEEGDVHRLIALEPDARNHLLLRLFYASGVRVSELCALRWRDVQARQEGGQVTIYGKGAKMRAVVLPAGPWRELAGMRGDAGPDGPVFISRLGGPLSKSQAWRIVRAAAVRAGIPANVSPHWLRHAHASHALDRGAPIHLVQATLGHASVATMGKYLHARPTESSGKYLAV